MTRGRGQHRRLHSLPIAGCGGANAPTLMRPWASMSSCCSSVMRWVAQEYLRSAPGAMDLRARGGEGSRGAEPEPMPGGCLGRAERLRGLLVLLLRKRRRSSQAGPLPHKKRTGVEVLRAEALIARKRALGIGLPSLHQAGVVLAFALRGCCGQGWRRCCITTPAPHGGALLRAGPSLHAHPSGEPRRISPGPGVYSSSCFSLKRSGALAQFDMAAPLSALSCRRRARNLRAHWRAHWGGALL